MFHFLEDIIYLSARLAPKDKACLKFLRFSSTIALDEFVDLCSKKPERFSFGKTFQLPLGYSYSSVYSEMFQ